MKQILQKIKQYTLVVLLVLMGNYGWGQTWSYDFGTATGTHPTNTASTAFLTNLPSGGGTYRVRTGIGGGTIILSNPGTTLGSGSELNIVSSTGTSTNKFGVYSWNSLTTVAAVKYKLRTTSEGAGNLNFSLGTSSLGSDSNGYTNSYNNSLTSITIAYSSGDISSVVRRINGSNITISSSGFAKNTDHSVEVFANNGNSTVNYVRNGTLYSLATKTWDFWLDNFRIVNNGATAGTLAANTNLAGFAFYAESSANNSASIFIDDLEYSNALPTNAAPTATSVSFSGTPNVGQQLTGSYAYSDADSDVQGTSTFKWYRADNASGLNSAAISGATATTYTLQAADVNKYIRFGVVPVAATGTSPGVEAFSSWQGPVTDPSAVTATLSTTGALTETNLTTEILTIDLSNTTFVDNVLATSNFTLNNAPAGVTVNSVVYNSSTSASLTFAYDGTDFDTNISNLSITIAGSELTSGASLTTSTLPITALTETLSVSTITDFGSQCLNTETIKTFTVSGTNLKAGNVNLASLTGFTYSLNGTTFTPTINIATSGGTLAATTVYVKFTPTSAQSYNGNIVVSGVGAPSQNRSVVASGINTTPTITTPTSTSITASSAVLGGNITVIGCNSITERGIYYSTVSNFVDGTGTKVSETSGSYSTGTFTVNVTGLTYGTTYYFKAFATSASGTSYTTSYGTFSTLKIEPANHPTNFVATGVTTGAIVPQWTASVAGSQAPDGYLIKASTTTVVDPVDGTDPANSASISGGSANRNVTPGTATSGTTFTGMSSGTMYNYKIYPYTNTGPSIDFKITDAPSFSHATLPTAPTNPTISNLQANTVSLTWGLGTHNAGNKVLVFVKQGSAITTGTPSTAPANYTANTIFGSGTAYQNDSAAFCVYKGDSNTVAISGLLANTTYHVVIYRAVEATNSNGTNSYSAVLTTSFATLTNPVTLPYTQNFETTTSEWLLDTSGTNIWAIGSATNNGGKKALYISNDSGTTNSYSTGTAQSGTNASVRVDLTGLTAATLSFDWKSNGELYNGTIYDYGEVYINNGGSDVLISGTKEFYNTTAFAQKSIDISAYVGSVVTIKFRWVNDGLGGNQPPFAVDNLSIVPSSIPNFTTTAITNITFNSATTGGTITTNGGSGITARGVVYATSPNPTIANSVVSNGSGNGAYTANLTGLLSNTTYYVRAYVTNANGTYYANEVSFTTANIVSPIATAPSLTTSTTFTATWNVVPEATAYEIDVYESNLSSNTTTETFTSIGGGTTSNYSTRSWTGNDNITWTAYNSRTDQVIFSGNDALTLKDASGSYLQSGEITGNPTNITFDIKQSFSGSGGEITLSILHGVSFGTTTQIGVYSYNSSTQNIVAPISGISGPFKVVLSNNTAARPTIDNLAITKTTGSLSYILQNHNVGNVTFYQVTTGLNPNTTYYYVVRALDATSESINSNEIQVITRPGTTTWNGNAWSDGAPLSDIDAFIDGDYDGSSFESKTITVNTGKTLTVNSFVKTGNVTNNGNIIVANGANFLQVGSFYSGDGASFKVRKDTKAVKRLAYMNWSSPMANSSQTLKQFSYGKNANGTAQSSTGTLDNRFYTYDKNAYVLTDPSGTFTEGQGYLIRTPNDFTTTPQIFHAQFEGTIPNAGTITYDHSSLQGNFILLGNPYPSAISYDDFMIKNTNTTGTVYVWNSQVEMVNNQYTGTIYNTFTSAGANPANSLDAYIPVGQGFFVQRTNNNPFVFTDTMRRTTEVGVTSKSSTVSKNRFWLELASPSGAKPQMLLGFFPGTNKGIDKGYDAILLDATTETLYSTVEDKKLIIDAHGGFDEADEFSLSANLTTGGNYTISLLQKEGIFSNGQKIYLKDNLTGAVTDLTTDKYEFTDTAGLKSNRFTLQFKSSGVLGSQDLAKEELNIISVGKEVRIKAGQNVATVEIYDLTGKKLIKVQPNQRETVINLSTEGMIVVKVTLQNGREKSKKLIIK